jgi:hypothetical protein
MSLKIQTMVVLIQVLDGAIVALGAECDATDGPDKPDLQELLLDYTLAAQDLKMRYQAARHPESNMPPYETLVTISV